MSQWLGLPADTLPLYVEAMTVTRYGQVMLSVSAYAFAAENFLAHTDGRHPDFKLPPGAYRMRVHLAGPDVASTFWFDVVNGGSGAHPVVTATEW